MCVAVSEFSMKRVGRVVIPLASIAIFLGLFPTAALADPAKVPERATPAMRVYGPAPPPYGFVDFCQRSPAECASGPADERRFVASPDRIAELETINRVVNTSIEPLTDLELYGVEEYWTLPTTKGDCEDYALLKRHLLIKRGWPVSSLLITVVKDEKGEGHAILTARTTQGDLILDNKVPQVLVWHRTGYEFVMRQSYINPRVWMSLDAREGQPSLAAISGVRARR
jgi:predicted transglutaminase-like cysteine proteinase